MNDLASVCSFKTMQFAKMLKILGGLNNSDANCRYQMEGKQGKETRVHDHISSSMALEKG